MIYKLKISNKSIDLVRLVTSPEDGKINEMKIANTELGFRFNRNLITTSEFFDTFVEKMGTLLEPFLADITELKISLRSNFFNIHSIPLDNLSRIEFETSYLNWEVNQYITNNCNEFLYGYIHNTSERKTIIIIIRKKIHEYFEKVFTSINGSIEQWNLGYDYLNNGELTYVSSKRKILPVYDENKKSLVAKTGETIKKFQISNVIKLLASVFLLIFITLSLFNKEIVVDKTLTFLNLNEFFQNDGTSNSVPLSKSDIADNSITIDSLNSTKTDTLDDNIKISNDNLIELSKIKNKNIFFNFIYNSMIDKSDVNLLILDKESSLLKFNIPNDANLFVSNKKNMKKKSFKYIERIGVSKDIVKIDFNENYNSISDIDMIEKSKKRFSEMTNKNKETIVLTSKSELLDLITDLFSNNFCFNKLKISVRNDKFYLVVDFD